MKRKRQKARRALRRLRAHLEGNGAETNGEREVLAAIAEDLAEIEEALKE